MPILKLKRNQVLKNMWKEELLRLKANVNEVLDKEPELRKKRGKGNTKAFKDISNLLNSVDECLSEKNPSDHAVMKLLNIIVGITQITTSQTLINVIQRSADYLWELHFACMPQE